MSLRHKQQHGFTLIELVLVIGLIALLTTLASSRLDSIIAWQYKRDIREFIATWEFLYSESNTRRKSYKLFIDIDRNLYFARQVIPPSRNRVVNVDYLENLRTKGEQARRQQEKEEKLFNLEQQFEEEDRRNQDPLEEQFYGFKFSDPNQKGSLGIPLEFPSLAKEKVFTDGLEIIDVKTPSEQITSGKTFINFSSRGVANFAVVHLKANEQIFSILMNPVSGEIIMKGGYKDYKWSLEENIYSN